MTAIAPQETKALYQLLIEEFGKRVIEKVPVPLFISSNLNPAFPLRPYQQRAFQYFLTYWQETFESKPRQNHQLLFHMATGSGKTLIMAGLILYLYERGYRNFLFFVNSNNIIEKTRDNFLNRLSSKFLFTGEVKLGDRPISVRDVPNFQASDSDAINIVFSTIQGLHQKLNVPSENSVTYEDFEDQKIVLISDEAHHINALTKKGPAEELELLEEVASWEGTVERIFKANAENVLLEFTATVDLTDDNLATKYRPKLVFDYPLKEFRRDGYSKEVKVVQADLTPFDRAIQAVLLNQYRRKIFEKHSKHIKPVILFKSRTIKESQDFLKEFRESIRKLSSRAISEIKEKATDPAMIRMFEYFDANGISFENLATEIREDFSDNKLIAVNSKEESEEKQLAVNSLEDADNEIRAVFAVDKLNEGWDVLNLFDIVRLYDTRDSKAGKTGKTTMSEAQLIGRGARYCPFQVADGQPLYGRKYDADLGNELRVCEELYYHSAYNPKYIQELNTALQELGIKPKQTRQRTLTLKETFKKSALYREGRIFLNRQEPRPIAKADGLGEAVILKKLKVNLRTGFTTSAAVFEKPSEDAPAMDRKLKDFVLKDFGQAIVRKALQRLDVFEFAALRERYPNLRSIREFIASESYLGKIVVEVSGLASQLASLGPYEKLSICTEALRVVAGVIGSEKPGVRGGERFHPQLVKDTFADRQLSFMIDDDDDQEFGKAMSDPAETGYYLDLSKRDWYAFNECYGTSEEKLMVQFLEKQQDEFRKKFSGIHLIRNEKHFKLFAFDDGRPLEPDFVLYLIGKNGKDTMTYQVFIEPKGSHLLKGDEWKEKFLLAIKGRYRIEELFADTKYTLWGLPFYNSESRVSQFSAAVKTVYEDADLPEA